MNGPRSLDRLVDGWKAELRSSNEFFSKTITHSGERGTHAEAALKKILRAVLPQKVGIGTGFIEFPNSNQSSQQDIILFDAINHAPLYANDDWQVYPLEMVLATIEVKMTLARNDDLCAAFESSQRIRQNSKERKFLIQDNSGRSLVLRQVSVVGMPAPRTFIFCYHAGTKKLQTFKQRLSDASKQFPESHVHGICVLDEDWFFHRKAYDGDTHEYHGVELAGWRKFLMTIYPILLFPDPNLVADRTFYLTGVTPDQVELGFAAPAKAE